MQLLRALLRPNACGTDTMNGFRALIFSLSLAAIAIQPAGAVPPGQVSWTARAVCEYRAIAAMHPDPKLRNGDSLANQFCGPVRLPRDYEAARDVMDDNLEAYAGYFLVNARTHHIDRWVERAAARGAQQVVILGAGFDSRAYRFAGRYPQLRFFEVDLPSTIDAKQQVVKRVMGSVPTGVHYVPIDFDTQSLATALTTSGYRASDKTLFILEGVTMYVTVAANDATLDFVAQHAAPGSVVVFDYVHRRVIEGDTAGLYAVGAEAKGVALVGEPFVTGWSPAEAAAFTRRHGLVVIDNLGTSDLMHRYLIGSDGKVDGRLPDAHGVIDAQVP